MGDISDNPLKRLIREIHRRSLWQVLGIYVVASWAVLGGVGTLGDALGLPDWFPRLALGLLVVGLPIVLATAFVQEGRPGDEAQASHLAAPGEEMEAQELASVSSRLFTWRHAILGGVGAFAVLGFVGTGWVLFGGGLPGPSGSAEALTSIEPSVAVMPCTDLSPEGNQGPLAQGLAEGIINALAQLPDLKVSGITSVIALVGQNADIGTVAETLDVETVLECGLQQEGDVIRIRPRLVEAATGAVLWSEEIDRPAENIFAIQDEVARAVTDQLQIVLARGDETPLVVQGTTVPGAHEAYLRGRYLWKQRTGASIQAAIAEFERAIELDPEYAEAYSGLADSYAVVGYYTPDPDWPTNLERNLSAAQRAVSFDPDLGTARASLGFVLLTGGEWEDADREFRRALELNPGYATAHQWYAQLLYSTGSVSEGVIHAEQAFELDPVSRPVAAELGQALLVAGRTEEAIARIRESAELYPAQLLLLATTLFDHGEHDEGLEAWLGYARYTDLPADRSRPRSFSPRRKDRMTTAFSVSVWTNPRNTLSPCIVTPSAT